MNLETIAKALYEAPSDEWSSGYTWPPVHPDDRAYHLEMAAAVMPFLAQAWDEGYGFGYGVGPIREFQHNPYRAES